MLGNNPKLVERYEELGTGMRVLIVGCSWCGGNQHKGMLMDEHTGEVVHSGGGKEVSPFYEVLPNPHPEVGRFAIGPTAVADKHVYRLPDGLDEDAKQFTAPKSKELVNVLVKR